MASQKVNWPNFFVVGPPKAGTTSIAHHLKKHPQVFIPDVKEPHYFSPHIESVVNLNLDEYRRLYEKASGYTAIGDLSASYFLYEEVPGRIFEVSPDARIVMMLRDPVARAYSDFTFARTLGIEPETAFRKALQRYETRDSPEWYLSRCYIEQGLYYSPVRRYQETFGKERVLLLPFDDLTRNPREFFARIATHIGVNPGFFETVDLSEALNEYRMPRWRSLVNLVRRLRLQQMIPASMLRRLRPLFFDTNRDPLDEESRRLLQEMYKPDVAQLEELMGRKFPELRKSWIEQS